MTAPSRFIWSSAGRWMLLVLALVQADCMLLPGESPAQTPSSVVPAAPSLLVLHHSDDLVAKNCVEQVRQTLTYAKIPHEEVDLASSADLPPLDAYRAVVVATGRLHVLSTPDARRLLQYVEAGGGLTVLFRGWHPVLAPALGHPEVPGPGYILRPNERLELHGHLISGAKGLALDSLSLWMLDFEAAASSLDSTATILATASRSGQPVAWFKRYGEGRVVFWNSVQLSFKTFRGTILQSIAAVQPQSVHPIANWGTLFLDDFPSPASPTKQEPIASELGLSPPAFYATRWYPDMRRLAEEFGLTYTSTVIFSYDDSVTPPYRFHEWLMGRVATGGRVVYYSPWIARRDARHSEVAFHGYNHEPLRLDIWPSAAHMTQGLTAARERWRIDDIAPMPTTYVPPMNRIDSTGMQALIETFPSLEIVAGLYGGEFALGQDREFGPEPWNDSLYALPRNTDGYILSDPQRLSMISLLEVLGVWGHFVHPDEVYFNEDRYKNLREQGVAIPNDGFPWYGEPAQDGLYYRFREWLTFARTQYPWLRYRTAREATTIMKAHDTLSWRWESETTGTLQIHTSQTPSFFVVQRPPNTPAPQIRGGTLLHRTETRLLTKFVVKAHSPLVTLRFPSPPEHN